MRQWLGSLLCALALSAGCAPALAKKGAVVVNTGDELFEVGPFPAEIVAQYPRTAALKVGYKCSHFGIFWADVWTWNCQLVAVTGENSYADLPPEVHDRLAGDPGYAFDHAQRSWWNHYAFWAALLALGIMVAWGLWPRRGAGLPAPAAGSASAA